MKQKFYKINKLDKKNKKRLILNSNFNTKNIEDHTKKRNLQFKFVFHTITTNVSFLKTL